MPARLILAAALLATAATGRAPAADSAAALQAKLASLVRGKPASCISQFPTNRSQTYDGAILYQVGGTTYVNRFGGSCRLRPAWDILITSTPSTQLCRGDIAQVVESGLPIPRGTCVYDDFESYTRPKRAK